MNAHTADDGVAEVIGFILIIALIVAVAAVWILVYIPSQGNAVETEHARLVTEEIADIKYGIDLLWINGRTDVTMSRLISPSPVQGTDISGLLFLSPPLGTGTVTVGEGNVFKVGGDTIKALKITYDSANYYAPDIRLVYDGGAVFFKEGDEDLSVFLSPSIGDSRLVFVTISNSGVNQQILGNIPLSVTYTYDTVTYYNNVNVTLVTSDVTNPWSRLISSGATYANVTVVQFVASIGGQQ